MALSLIPVMWYLADRRLLPARLARLWVLLPAAAFTLSTTMMGPKDGHNIAGFTMLLVNLGVLGWAAKNLLGAVARETQLAAP
jgi:hypothetical protein